MNIPGIRSKCPVCGNENGIHNFHKIFPLKKDSVQCQACNAIFCLPNWITPLYFAEYIIFTGILLMLYWLFGIGYSNSTLKSRAYLYKVGISFCLVRMFIAGYMVPVQKRELENESSETLPFSKRIKKTFTCPSCGTENCIEAPTKLPAILSREKKRCKNCGVEVCAMARYVALIFLVDCVIVYLYTKASVSWDRGLQSIILNVILLLSIDISEFIISYFVPLRVW